MINITASLPPEVQEQSHFSAALHVVTGLFWDVIYNLSTLSYRFAKERGAAPAKSSGLAVFIHGMNHSPGQFHEYCEEIRKVNKQVTILAPRVKNRGQCAVEEAAQEIFAQISQWRKNNQKKPIVLVGISNGGRLAALLGDKLVDSGHPVKVVCIAAPLYGTTMLNPSFSARILAVWQRIAKLLYHEKVVEELSYNSPKAIEIIGRMQNAAKKGVSFDFYSSLSNTVRPVSSSYPSGVQNSRHFLLKYAGHDSILREIKEKVVSDTITFISKK